MKLTMNDLVTANYTPHTIISESSDGTKEPKGLMVLHNGNGTDIGEALMSGDFEAENPYVEMFGQVLGATLMANPAESAPPA